MEILVVVDVQNDFVTGALGTPEAEKIISEVVATIHSARGKVFYTMDTHDESYLSTMEGKKLPVLHCLKGTKGWEVQADVNEALQATQATKVEKPTFGSYQLVDAIREIDQQNDVTLITLVGICTDICVISNALLLKAAFPNIAIQVKASACSGVTPTSHEQALATMQMCHIDVVA